MMEVCLDVHETFFLHILIPLGLFSFHCNELYSFSQMGFRNDDFSFHYCLLLTFCLWSSKVCIMFFCGFCWKHLLLVSRAVVWDTVGMHNGYVLWEELTFPCIKSCITRLVVSKSPWKIQIFKCFVLWIIEFEFGSVEEKEDGGWQIYLPPSCKAILWLLVGCCPFSLSIVPRLRV